MTGARRYVALLRGINVGGRTLMRMADLRAQCQAAGLSDVATHIQSGNVVFRSTQADPERIATALAAQLQSGLGYTGRVFVRTPVELSRALARNPFDVERQDAEQQCHLMFLSDEPADDAQKRLMAMQGDDYRFAIDRHVLYIAYPRPAAGSRRSIDFERVLGVTGTARTQKVVQRLVELAA